MPYSTPRMAIVAVLLCLAVTFPTPVAALGNPTLPSNQCLAGKIKCVTRHTSCLLGCYAKAAKGGLALDVATDACLVKCRAKFDGGTKGPAASCFGKLEAKGGCLHDLDSAALGVKTEGFVLNAVAKLDAAPLDDPSTCRSGKLKCVSKYDKCVQGLFAKAAKGGGQIDPSKLSTCRAIATGGTKGLAGSCFGKLEAKGNCETDDDSAVLAAQDDAFIDDAIATLMLGAKDVHNERCTGDTSVKCTSAPGGLAGCGGPLGTCEFWFGGPQPISVGGVSVCAVNRWVGAVAGTLNQQSGASAWDGTLLTALHVGVTLSSPCPKCSGDTALNDGLAQGTCSTGLHGGSACDANGTTSVEAFGATSLDCPPVTASLISFHRLDLSSNNTGASLTLSAASPDCNGAPGKKCACGSCSGDSMTPCTSDGDCLLLGVGTCTNAAGAPRRPSACIDSTVIPGPGGCVDMAPVGDGAGRCSESPIDQHCAIESFRGCLDDLDCPLSGDFCTSSFRRCYLDNGVIGGTIVAAGAHSTPVDHASYGTFASVHCVAPAASAAVNFVFGLPGAGRLRIGGLLTENGTSGACPSRASFVVTNADGVQDLGWSGFGHDLRWVTQSKLAMDVTGCTGPAPSCGECTLSGPILNPDAVP